MMNRVFLLSVLSVLMLTSCVSKKKYAELEEKQKETQDQLNTATIKLNSCLEDKKTKVSYLEDQVETLKKTNNALLTNQGDLATLSKKGAENLERSLESIKKV